MGKTIIISSHILAELEEMCTDVAIMEAGRLLAVRPAAPDPGARSAAARRSRVRFADGTSSVHRRRRRRSRPRCCAASSSTRGATVVEFVEEHDGLEQLFLSITEGIVQ